ncbi:hypothetical protein H310_02698 [Aphanomyces invadans]|uniref:Uncharacterized protein n=1 Tax=Aphanomyces invadans TaxID=157072 RepID=A0A024UKT4_9STRA|nr:hypothetical protein H310_02698 [Aphanomyces invadans]ETW06442.1 hypothetical protein H310_02698 [Aphanomyces invadans]|eukprot:XP_008864517.1 hypothetical protein H310_02698 [Aphanomyces invadans]
MVQYAIAGCVDQSDYTVCERLLDIMAAALPDITVDKEPVRSDTWRTRVLELAQLHGFTSIGDRDWKIAQVMVWRVGRLVAHRAEEFALYVADTYGLALDLDQGQVEAYTQANTRALLGVQPPSGPHDVAIAEELAE